MKLRTVAILIFITAITSVNAQMLNRVASSHITPQGWIGDMLNMQQRNFINELNHIFPFSQGGWGSTPFTRTIKGKVLPFWVPYEQTAYYYDGVLRCGYLLHSKHLIDMSRKAIYGTIATADKNGVMLSSLANGDMRRWPHAVFFRAMMEEYANTKDSKIIKALSTHYKNDTVTYAGRDLCNIEIMAWLYSINHDTELRDKCLSLLNAKFSNTETLYQYLNQISSASPTEIHAVTFHEMLKVPAILFSLTGNSKYLDIARRAYAKIDHLNMLPDGVPSGEEGLSGNHGTNSHEMCNVIDYIWTTSYMLRITKDTEYADRIERALFNAGMGGITKNFDAHQYYSSPNQIVAHNHSSNVSVYDDSRMAFRQVHRPQCCTSNLNRLLPIYVETEWLVDYNNGVYKMLYGPGSTDIDVNGSKFTLREVSAYPFGDTIKIYIERGNGSMNLHLRVPSWASSPQAYFNSEKLSDVKAGNYIQLNRTFHSHDSITLIFPKSVIFNRSTQEEMTVNYGPLLMALPIKATIKRDSILSPKIQSQKYMGYTMTPASDWNYILGMKSNDKAEFKVMERAINTNSNPWNSSEASISIILHAFKTDSWHSVFKKINGNYYEITPEVPTRGSMIYALNGLKPQAISLIPYGCTNLRISMFPFWTSGEIPSEVLATDNK